MEHSQFLRALADATPNLAHLVLHLGNLTSATENALITLLSRLRHLRSLEVGRGKDVRNLLAAVQSHQNLEAARFITTQHTSQQELNITGVFFPHLRKLQVVSPRSAGLRSVTMALRHCTRLRSLVLALTSSAESLGILGILSPIGELPNLRDLKLDCEEVILTTALLLPITRCTGLETLNITPGGYAMSDQEIGQFVGHFPRIEQVALSPPDRPRPPGALPCTLEVFNLIIRSCPLVRTIAMEVELIATDDPSPVTSHAPSLQGIDIYTSPIRDPEAAARYFSRLHALNTLTLSASEQRARDRDPLWNELKAYFETIQESRRLVGHIQPMYRYA